MRCTVCGAKSRQRPWRADGLSREGGLVTFVVAVVGSRLGGGHGIVVREHVAVTDNGVGADGRVLHGGEDSRSKLERMEVASARVEEQIQGGGAFSGGDEVLPFGLVLRRRGALSPASAEETLPLSTFLPTPADDFRALVVLFLFFVVEASMYIIEGAFEDDHGRR